MAAPESSDDPQQTDPPVSREAIDPTTRLVLARLTTGASRLAESAKVAPRSTGLPNRLEAGALAAALVAATLLGAAMPGSPDARAQGAAPISYVAAPVAPTGAVAAATASSADEPASSADTTAAETPADAPLADPVATPAAADTADTAADDPSSDDDAAGDEGDGSDPLAGSGDRLDQVALVIVHGDAPVLWAKGSTSASASRLRAADQTPGQRRAASGTTLTGLAVIPGAPLVNSLGLIAGQASNPLTRAGCPADGAASPLAPGTVDDLGRVSGTGCDYPAATPSLPTAVAVDGRRWRAYAPVAAGEAAGALCGTGSPAGTPGTFAATSALRRLTDLASSGACDGAAAPLSDLAADLRADDPPAWIEIEVGACPAAGCDADAQAARDRDLDSALATLTGTDGLGASSAVIVVGDGTAAGLEPAPAGSLPAAPDDPNAPAAVLSGALLLGHGVAAGTTDPLPLDPFAIARTQADWLGLDAPGWAKAEGVTGLAVPSG